MHLHAKATNYHFHTAFKACELSSSFSLATNSSPTATQWGVFGVWAVASVCKSMKKKHVGVKTSKFVIKSCEAKKHGLRSSELGPGFCGSAARILSATGEISSAQEKQDPNLRSSNNAVGSASACNTAMFKIQVPQQGDDARTCASCPQDFFASMSHLAALWYVVRPRLIERRVVLCVFCI